MKKVLKERDMQESAEALGEHPIQLDRGLTHDETIRGSALAIACRYYTDTIVKNGDLYREMVRDGKVLRPATYVRLLEVALAFEVFIRGELKRTAEAVVETPNDEPLRELDPPEADKGRPTPEQK